MKNTLLAAIAIATIAIAGVYHVQIINLSIAKSDLVPVWLGVRATLAGQDPYSDATTRAIQTAYYGRPLVAADGDMNQMGFAYPVHTAIVLAWLAPLSWPTARGLCLVLFAVITAASVPLWLDVIGARITRDRVALSVLATMASWPVIWSLRLEQVSLIVAALVALACWLLKHGHDAAAGTVLALATIKPQLIAPLVAWLFLWALVARRWYFLAALTGTTTALVVAAEALTPGWLPRWRQAGLDLLAYTHQRPTLTACFGTVIGGTMMLALAAIATAALWRLRKTSVDSLGFGIAIGLALSVTLALMPTDLPMIYNQVLLVPGCVLLLEAGERACVTHSIGITFLAWGFLAVLVAAIGDFFLPHSNTWRGLPFWNELLPVAVTVALAVGCEL